MKHVNYTTTQRLSNESEDVLFQQKQKWCARLIIVNQLLEIISIQQLIPIRIWRAAQWSRNNLCLVQLRVYSINRVGSGLAKQLLVYSSNRHVLKPLKSHCTYVNVRVDKSNKIQTNQISHKAQMPLKRKWKMYWTFAVAEAFIELTTQNTSRL